jgi:NET1-associated nuclear protein 1 (U3 small nucleolar RNA-associated protein 17)
MGPESNTIEEPNVAHVQASADGQWLATVDEWMPPKRDLAPLAFDQERVVAEQISRQEVYLKFWWWKEDMKVWELVSRIDNPHASKTGNPYDKGRVLELASDPSTATFATVGEDGIVKTWRPAIRRRHGLEVRSKDGISLTTWHCKHAIPLEATGLITEKSAQGAKLAYSQDGSVLAAGLQLSTPSPIYLIDAYSGEIRSVQTGLCSGPLLGLGVINKYLITLSHELCVWNLVTDERQYGIQLKEHGLSWEKQRDMTHLAVDTQNGLFAISVPQVGQVSKMIPTLKSQVAVFEPANASPFFLTSLPYAITNLLPATRRKGFHTINSAAEVRTLAPSQSSTSVSMALAEDENALSRGLTNIFGNGQNAKAVKDGAGKLAGLLTSNRDSTTRELHVQRDDAVVVSADRLAELFDVGPAYALPPVTELFEQVASLYSGRVR